MSYQKQRHNIEQDIRAAFSEKFCESYLQMMKETCPCGKRDIIEVIYMAFSIGYESNVRAVMQEFTDNEILSELIRRHGYAQCPIKSEYSDDWREVLIGITDDETAQLRLHIDGLSELDFQK